MLTDEGFRLVFSHAKYDAAYWKRRCLLLSSCWSPTQSLDEGIVVIHLQSLIRRHQAMAKAKVLMSQQRAWRSPASVSRASCMGVACRHTTQDRAARVVQRHARSFIHGSRRGEDISYPPPPPAAPACFDVRFGTRGRQRPRNILYEEIDTSQTCASSAITRTRRNRSQEV